MSLSAQSCSSSGNNRPVCFRAHKYCKPSLNGMWQDDMIEFNPKSASCQICQCVSAKYHVLDMRPFRKGQISDQPGVAGRNDLRFDLISPARIGAMVYTIYAERTSTMLNG